MAIENPLTLLALSTLVRQIVEHTRPVPAGSAELTQSVNFGYGKAIRALASVRNQNLQSFVDPFTLLSGVTEYDLDAYDPVVWKPHKLIVDGSGGTTRVITFRYRAITSAEFQDSETARAGTFNTLYYDLLTGMLPGTPTTTAAGSAGSSLNLVAGGGAFFQVGNLVSIPFVGPSQTLPGGALIPTTYIGLVVAIAGDTLTVAPPFTGVVGSPLAVTPLRRRILKIVPASNATISGRLWYQYRPPKLVNDTDTVDPLLSEHRDMIVWYAASMLVGAVNDAQSRVWFEQAQEMRSEALQDWDPLSGQASEALDSDLWGTK